MRPPGHKVVESSLSSNRQPTISTQQAAQLKVKSISYTRLPACPPAHSITPPPSPYSSGSIRTLWPLACMWPRFFHCCTPLATQIEIGPNWFVFTPTTTPMTIGQSLSCILHDPSIPFHSYLGCSPVLFVIRNVMPLFQIAKGAKKKKKNTTTRGWTALWRRQKQAIPVIEQIRCPDRKVTRDSLKIKYTN